MWVCYILKNTKMCRTWGSLVPGLETCDIKSDINIIGSYKDIGILYNIVWQQKQKHIKHIYNCINGCINEVLHSMWIFLKERKERKEKKEWPLEAKYFICNHPPCAFEIQLLNI